MKTQRSAHAKQICRRVTDKINAAAPPGLGYWEPAWVEVEEPSDAFLDALDCWVENDTPETREAVKSTTRDLVQAWRRVGRLFLDVAPTPPSMAGKEQDR